MNSNFPDPSKHFTLLGVIAGFLLALIILQFGFDGLLISLVLAAVGGLIGAHLDGRIDLAALLSRLGRGGRG